jgi:hypothetical protein
MDTIFLRDMRQHDRESRARADYGYKTLEIYEYKYRRAVDSIVASLNKFGLDINALDEYAKGVRGEAAPGGIIVPPDGCIQQIGKQLGILADQIKEP